MSDPPGVKHIACTLDFEQLSLIVRMLNVPDKLTPLPGWLTLGEQRTLYALAYILDGPILEIGAWIGRSTSVIARGIRDAGRYKRFVTCELNPTLENFRPAGTEMGFFVPPESDVCLGLASMHSWATEIEPILR